MTTIEKPPHGSPCNSCGGCCRAVLCPLGAHVFGQEAGPCPALMYQPEGQANCGLVVAPGRFDPVRTLRFGQDALSAAARLLVGAGIGCDALAEGEKPNRRFYKAMDAFRAGKREYVRLALYAWGMLR
jgi:hypothetical protein